MGIIFKLCMYLDDQRIVAKGSEEIIFQILLTIQNIKYIDVSKVIINFKDKNY